MQMVDASVHAAEKATVGVVQVNMGTFQKRDEPREGLRRHREDSLRLEAEHDLDLLVWPESAVVYALPSRITDLKDRVLGRVGTPTVFGAVRTELTPEGRKVYNTAYIVDEHGVRRGYYDKVYRLAFGEYLPLGETFPILYEWSPHSGRFERGRVRTPLPFREHDLAALICYEDILPRYVNSLMSEVDPPPDLLLNITNDSWFGRTTEPRIHLALSTFRSVEQRRWLVRATNSGISAFVDPNGRITATTPLMERATLVGEVSFHEGRTVYSRVGWLFDWACTAVAVPMLLIGPARRRRRKKKG
jgi:apolipoprotein N-acyltransferase